MTQTATGKQDPDLQLTYEKLTGHDKYLNNKTQKLL